MLHLTCALKAVEEHAQKIAFIQGTSTQRDRPCALRRIETVHLSDMTVPSVAASTHVSPAATPLLHEGLKSASAAEVLMSAAMSRPQDTWNVPSPAGATFNGAAASYSPLHETMETVV